MSYENEKPSTREKDVVSEDSGSVQHIDTVGRTEYSKIVNPLAGIPHDQLMAQAARFARAHNLEHISEEIQKGALVAQDPAAFESLSQLNEDDKAILRREITHRWDQPWQLYYLVILCSLAAAVQGVSCGLVFLVTSAHLDLRICRWTSPLSTAPTCSLHPSSASTPGLTTQMPAAISGCSVSSTLPPTSVPPTLSHPGRVLMPLPFPAVLRCHLMLAHPPTQPVARPSRHHLRHRFHLVRDMYLARRHQLMAAPLRRSLHPRFRYRPQVHNRSRLCCRVRARGHSWCIGHDVVSTLLFHRRLRAVFNLSTITRQMWTAFGIMIGNVMDLAFFHVPDKHNITGLNWRLMLGSVRSLFCALYAC